MATHTQTGIIVYRNIQKLIKKNDNQADKQNQNNSQIADRHRPKTDPQ